MRVDAKLGAALDSLAAERNLSVSHLVRKVLAEAVSRREDAAALDARTLVDRLSADVAEIGRRLAG